MKQQTEPITLRYTVWFRAFFLVVAVLLVWGASEAFTLVYDTP